MLYLCYNWEGEFRLFPCLQLDHMIRSISRAVHTKWLQLIALSKSWLSEDTNYTDQFPCRITAAKRIAFNGFHEDIGKRFGRPLTQGEA